MSKNKKSINKIYAEIFYIDCQLKGLDYNQSLKLLDVTSWEQTREDEIFNRRKPHVATIRRLAKQLINKNKS